MVALPVELRAEDGSAGKAAEDGEVKDKDDLIDDGHAGHGGGAQPPYHHVVQKVYKLGDALLDDHGDDEQNDRDVKRLGPDKFFQHKG